MPCSAYAGGWAKNPTLYDPTHHRTSAFLGIVSKSVQKLVGRLTLFQGISQLLIHRKQHNNKRLVLLDGIERAVQSENLQLGSLRRSPFLYGEDAGVVCHSLAAWTL